MSAGLWLMALLTLQEARPFGEERQLLDRRLLTLRRILPDGPTLAADVAVVREIADGLKLQAFDALARPVLERGSPGFQTVDLSGVARFADIDRFFRQMALHPRLIDVESLTLKASPEDTILFTAVVRFPFRPLKAPLPPPPLSSRPHGAPSKAQGETFLHDQALALAKSEAIAALRYAQRNPRLFLAELSAISRDRPVVLTDAKLEDEFQVRGLTLGESASQKLQARFASGFLRVSDFVMVRQGACRRFEARGTSPVAGLDAELPLPTEEPFRQDEVACRVDRDAERWPPIEAPSRGARSPGQGPLVFRLRDMDLSDVLSVLHVVTGESFAVDGDVSGRASVEMSRVTLEEALAMLRKAGLRVAQGEALVRVSRAGGSLAPPLVGPPLPTFDSTRRASFSLKRADVRELLAVMTDLDPAYASLGPQGSFGRVSLWTHDVAMSSLRASVLETAGLKERIEDGRRILYRPMAAEDPVFPVAEPQPEQRLVLRPQDMDVREFELAGVAGNGSQWFSFAYSPTGVLHAYKVGDRLSDGVVKSIESTDVTLQGEDGPVRVVLPPR